MLLEENCTLSNVIGMKRFHEVKMMTEAFHGVIMMRDVV